MTELIYLEDPYVKEFKAKVEDIRGNEVFLSRTAFYPGGGGQPADSGTLKFSRGNARVISVNRESLGHVTEGELPEIGEEITGIIDWDRRYKIMRTHTAVHVLSGVAYQEFGVIITGNQLYEGRARLDLSFDSMTRELAEEIVEKSNEIIGKNLKVKWYFIPKDEFLNNPKLMRVNPKLYEKYDRIRVVEIEGFDIQADGGTHVKRLREIGKITLEKYQSKGKKNKRIYITLEEQK
ncbi:MAG: alanyl-tRNA editing protein [Euryarchaeota archaeon]|nr:alanyl-tRNA editing protein [Euryarchaeota archaeon]